MVCLLPTGEVVCLWSDRHFKIKSVLTYANIHPADNLLALIFHCFLRMSPFTRLV
jgi:hypothetical protein